MEVDSTELLWDPTPSDTHAPDLLLNFYQISPHSKFASWSKTAAPTVTSMSTFQPTKKGQGWGQGRRKACFSPLLHFPKAVDATYNLVTWSYFCYKKGWKM